MEKTQFCILITRERDLSELDSENGSTKMQIPRLSSKNRRDVISDSELIDFIVSHLENVAAVVSPAELDSENGSKKKPRLSSNSRHDVISDSELIDFTVSLEENIAAVVSPSSPSCPGKAGKNLQGLTCQKDYFFFRSASEQITNSFLSCKITAVTFGYTGENSTCLER